jgi:hypothetical protein
VVEAALGVVDSVSADCSAPSTEDTVAVLSAVSVPDVALCTMIAVTIPATAKRIRPIVHALRRELRMLCVAMVATATFLVSALPVRAL